MVEQSATNRVRSGIGTFPQARDDQARRQRGRFPCLGRGSDVSVARVTHRRGCVWLQIYILVRYEEE